MKFSLIICTYMRPIALLKVLETVVTQTLYPDEILIIDGSSNHETKTVLEQNYFKNLKYYLVSDKERGLTRQRNFGIGNVDKKLDVVCFLDDDTQLEVNYFKNLLQTYLKFPKALAVGGYIINDIEWSQTEEINKHLFYYDGWVRKESSRFKLRKKLHLLDDTPPGWMPKFSNGRSVSFLPPSNKVYQVEQIMGGVASYRMGIFKEISFSKYFEGYGLYEDADFSLRLAKKGNLYINTAARLAHYHDTSGRPNQFNYGKMVTRNGWYVWRVKYAKPKFIARIKWNAIAIVLMIIRFINVVTTKRKKEALTEALGRFYGLASLLFNRPKVER